MTATVTPLASGITFGPSFVRASFIGISGSGAISISGLKVGDVLIWVDVVGPPDSVIPSTQRFEAIVSVDNELQQTSGSSGVSYTIICLRGV